MPMRIQGKALAEIRSRTPYSGATFARDLGISPQFLSDIEKGRRNAKPDLIRQMAKLLGCSVGALIREPEEAKDEAVAS